MNQVRADIPVLYEDNHLLAVVKPAGLLSQSDSSGQSDLLTLCRDYIGQKYNKPGQVYLGLVHRLDRAVAGVMVFARTSKAAARICRQFKEGTVQKIYHAVTEGVPPQTRGTRVDYMYKDTEQRMSLPATPEHPEARRAELSYQILKTLKHPRNAVRLGFLEVELLTGRFHQIRFQLSHMGFPILGDRKYQARHTVPHDIALRAFRLQLQHPVTKEPLVLTSPDPVDWPFLGSSK